MFLLALSLSATCLGGQEASVASAELTAPVQLSVDGAVLDISDDHSYSGPWVVDIDGDAKRDLVVTSIFGKLRWFQNVSDSAEPKLVDRGHVKHDGKPIEFWNW